jgi:hypothetical protein
MEAEMVWGAWRKVLRERPIQDAMFTDGLAYAAAGLGLGADELDVIEEYARSPAGTRFFIANYRFRMISSFTYALETSAPLTHRLLRRTGADIDTLAAEFLETVRWRDFGPYVYTFGGDILTHLSQSPQFTAITGARELAELELAGIRVVRAAATGGREAVVQQGLYQATEWFETVYCPLDLSGWLRDTGAIGRLAPEARPRSYLVYLRPPQLVRRIVVLPQRAADMMVVLRQPHSLKTLAAALADLGHRADAAVDTTLIERLAGLGAVRRAVDGA